MILIIFLLFGYLLGSVPFGLLLTRIAGLGDIRKTGSGNIGATNVLRLGNKPLALAVLLLDGSKGAIAVLLAQFFMSAETGVAAGILAGVGAIFGHCFPIWLSFKGGKGVATFLGTLFALFPPAGFLACFLWAMTALFSRLSSLAALVTAAFTPVGFFLWNEASLALASAVMSLVIFIRHRDNIKRLRAHQEPFIGER